MAGGRMAGQDDQFWRTNRKTITIISLLLSPILVYLLYQTFKPDKPLVPMAYFVGMVGSLVAFKRVAPWHKLLCAVLGAFAISLLLVVPAWCYGDPASKYINGWATMFFMFLLMIIVTLNFHLLLPKITEGVVLLQTMALVYWLVNQVWAHSDNLLNILFIIVSIIFGISTLYHAFGYQKHTSESRFILSVWSCIIVSFMGYDCLRHGIEAGDIEAAKNTASVIFLTINYFVMGVSVIYVACSVLVVVTFFFSDKDMSKKEHDQAMKELAEIHISRFDTRQVRRAHASLALLYTFIVFGTNYVFKLLPVNFVIWCVFITFPLVVYLYDRVVPPAAHPSFEPEIDTPMIGSYYKDRKRYD